MGQGRAPSARYYRIESRLLGAVHLHDVLHLGRYLPLALALTYLLKRRHHGHVRYLAGGLYHVNLFGRLDDPEFFDDVVNHEEVLHPYLFPEILDGGEAGLAFDAKPCGIEPLELFVEFTTRLEFVHGNLRCLPSLLVFEFRDYEQGIISGNNEVTSENGRASGEVEEVFPSGYQSRIKFLFRDEFLEPFNPHLATTRSL